MEIGIKVRVKEEMSEAFGGRIGRVARQASGGGWIVESNGLSLGLAWYEDELEVVRFEGAEKVGGQREGYHKAVQRQVDYLLVTLKGEGEALKKALGSLYGVMVALNVDEQPTAYQRSNEVRAIQAQIREARAIVAEALEELCR